MLCIGGTAVWVLEWQLGRAENLTVTVHEAPMAWPCAKGQSPLDGSVRTGGALACVLVVLAIRERKKVKAKQKEVQSGQVQFSTVQWQR